MFFGSDDDVRTNGNNWLVNLFATHVNPPGTGNPATFDGSQTRATFFMIGSLDRYGADVAQSMQRAYAQGNEIGNHTYSHKGGLTYDGWLNDIAAGNAVITRATDQKGIGVASTDIFGFRAPEDKYNPDLYRALQQMGFTYDASIMEGYEAGHDGTNEYWPYTLDEGSPGANWNKANKITSNVPPGNVPGLWELPEAVYRIPPELRPKYGSSIYGCDWNWIHERKIDKQDMVTIFKYNLDLRLSSNRAPLQLCLHSQYYGVEKWFTAEDRASIAAMQDALTQMLEYALSKPEVRVVRGIDLISWMRNPAPLGQQPSH